ncbi:hypothetical protein B6U84_05990 [Candidatus Bathyarchaeota archaeon ex4484_40]|nr:MAG: hypothetical protein B6U84_05990 [Candidatus Bathyarchaeota archaeon ex4484_40]
MSRKLAGMLNALPRRNERVFRNASLASIRATFCKSWVRAAQKLRNPRLLRIHFHTFRHWKATMLYHQTKDILCVMRFLGHRNVNNTLLYVQLEEALFGKEPDEFVCKVAKTVGRLRGSWRLDSTTYASSTTLKSSEKDGEKKSMQNLSIFSSSKSTIRSMLFFRGFMDVPGSVMT